METATYSRIARLLHWAMAVLIIGNLAGGLLHDIAPRLIMPAHFATGLTVLVLALVRLAWRLTHRAPAWPAHMAGWERWTASLTHWLLYALMILVPLSGWVMVSAGERPISIYGLFEIPKLGVEPSEAFKDIMEERHELLAFATIGLLLLHIAAALRHRYMLKDGMLARMLG